MPRAIKAYVTVVERVNRWVGLVAMYLIFAMMGILLYSSIAKTIAIPPAWTLEMAQFTMVAYYILGGAHSMKMDTHVRMDLLYSRWSDKTKAWVDLVTVFALVVYLIVLIYGGFSSSFYAWEYGETSYSAWAPYMLPIKLIMVLGIVLMLLQTVAAFFRDLGRVRGWRFEEGAGEGAGDAGGEAGGSTGA